MYIHEFKTALIQRLSAIAEVQRVNYLQYWGEQIYFVQIDPASDVTQHSANSALSALLDEQPSARRPNIRLRFVSPGEHMPSSATLYLKTAPVIA